MASLGLLVSKHCPAKCSGKLLRFRGRGTMFCIKPVTPCCDSLVLLSRRTRWKEHQPERFFYFPAQLQKLKMKYLLLALTVVGRLSLANAVTAAGVCGPGTTLDGGYVD